jgi:predicted nucleic acid-binding protein
MVISGRVLDELIRTISARRPDLLPVVDRFLVDTPAELAPEPAPESLRKFSVLINIADAPILAAAVESRADCLVSGNTRHFTRRVARRAGIAIFTPAAYVANLPSSLPEGYGA